MSEEECHNSQEDGDEGRSSKTFRAHRFSLGSAAFVSTFSEDGSRDAQPRPHNPLENASVLSKLFFTWPRNLMEKKDKPATEADLPDVLEADTSAFNLKDFQEMWESEKKRADEVTNQYHQDVKMNDSLPPSPPKEAYPSLSRAIVNHFMSTLWLVQLCMFLSSVGKLVQAFALGCLLQSIERRDGNSIMWALLLSGSGIVSIISIHHAFFLAWRKG